MSDVFISYKQERRAHAERLAVILAAHGYDVWWDYRLVPGDRFRTTIENEINTARAVVVLWCRSAIESNFVIDEADHARKANKLLQATIETIEPPLGFRSLDHRLCLAEWRGNADHELVDRLLVPIARLVGREARRPRDLIRALSISLSSLPSIAPIEGESGASIGEDFGLSAPSEPVAQRGELDRGFYHDCKTADDLENYLKQFPDGLFCDAARTKLKALDAQWISDLGLKPKDWSTLFRDDLLDKLGPRASRAELEPRAKRGSPEALTLLALLSSRGGDDDEAMRLYLLASESGFPRAQLGVGVLLEDGRSGEKDKNEATKWYRRAAAQNNALAQFFLFRALFRGRSSADKKVEASEWLRKSADQGLDQAQFSLACAFEDGYPGILKDPAKALQWCRLAADAGHLAAQNHIGTMFENGVGTPVDFAEASKWYHKAAQQGSRWAQYNFARMLDAGRGTEEKPADAFTWFLAAAEQGHASSQFECGRMSELGRGTKKDPAAAMKWYKQAARLIPEAKSALDRLSAR